jgi:hypothetical protein
MIITTSMLINHIRDSLCSGIVYIVGSSSRNISYWWNAKYKPQNSHIEIVIF